MGRNLQIISDDDYTQSANTLFHFMNEKKFLTEALARKGLVPRYCIEDIEYLGVKVEDVYIKQIGVLQKCFCDIPFHKLTDNFTISPNDNEFELLSIEEKEELLNNNSHPDYYGKFAIAFSKEWGIRHNLQPIHYVNSDTNYALDFKKFFDYVLSLQDAATELVNDIENRLGYMKPLRGKMIRKFGGKKIVINKNFHDEKEWRYVPPIATLEKLKIRSIIVKRHLIEKKDMISREFEKEKYKEIWLQFYYDDIRYLIVPESSDRIELIKFIMELPQESFIDDVDINTQKYILISKILVLNEIRKDW